MFSLHFTITLYFPCDCWSMIVNALQCIVYETWYSCAALATSPYRRFGGYRPSLYPHRWQGKLCIWSKSSINLDSLALPILKLFEHDCHGCLITETEGAFASCSTRTSGSHKDLAFVPTRIFPEDVSDPRPLAQLEHEGSVITLTSLRPTATGSMTETFYETCHRCAAIGDATINPNKDSLSETRMIQSLEKNPPIDILSAVSSSLYSPTTRKAADTKWPQCHSSLYT